jgi:hypothetical protein
LASIYKRIDSPPSDGKCAGQDVKMWFPHAERDGVRNFSAAYRSAGEQTLLAKNICTDCKKQEQCLSYALHHESYGIWGGTTESERKVLRKKYNISLIIREPFSPVMPRSRDPRE